MQVLSFIFESDVNSKYASHMEESPIVDYCKSINTPATFLQSIFPLRFTQNEGAILSKKYAQLEIMRTVILLSYIRVFAPRSVKPFDEQFLGGIQTRPWLNSLKYRRKVYTLLTTSIILALRSYLAILSIIISIYF